MSDPVLLSRQIITKALSDPAFYTTVPEFASLKPKLRTMGVDLSSKRGCRGCKQRRVQQNIYRDFLGVMSGLPAASAQNLKRYLGADRLMFTVRNSTTGGYESRVI